MVLARRTPENSGTLRAHPEWTDRFVGPSGAGPRVCPGRR